MRGTYLKTKVDILSNTYRPESATIPFNVEAPDISLNLSLPRWNTNALHVPREGNNIARIRLLHVKGSYQYFSDVREEHIDQLNLTFTVIQFLSSVTSMCDDYIIQLHDVAYKALGWSIRYFMVLRDNYFGSFTQFSTLNEYLEKRKRNLPPGDPIMEKYRKGKVHRQFCVAPFYSRIAEQCPSSRNQTGHRTRIDYSSYRSSWI